MIPIQPTPLWTSRAMQHSVEGARYFIYERVSTRAQQRPEHGRHGQDRQDEELRRYAHNLGVPIAGVYWDQISGWREDVVQNGLVSLINVLQRGDTILVYFCDRLSRNLVNATQYLTRIHQKGAVVYSIKDNVHSTQPRFMEIIGHGEYFSWRQSQLLRGVRRHREDDEDYEAQSSESSEDYESEEESVEIIPNPIRHARQAATNRIDQYLETVSRQGASNSASRSCDLPFLPREGSSHLAPVANENVIGRMLIIMAWCILVVFLNKVMVLCWETK